MPAGLWMLAGFAGLWAPAAVGVGLAAAGWLLPAAVLAGRAGQARRRFG
jgi:hypothetical protein